MTAHDLRIEKVVADYLEAIYRFAYRLVGDGNDAADIAQEVMVKVWRNWSKYNPSQDLRPWLFKIAHHTVIDHLRRRQQIPFSQLDNNNEEGGGITFADNLPDLESLPDEVFAQTEIKEKFVQALAEFSAGEQIIVSLHLDEGLTFDEIAQITNRPLNTVKSIYRRSLIKLRTKLVPVAPK